MCWHLGASPGELNIVAPLKYDDEMMSRGTEKTVETVHSICSTTHMRITVKIFPILTYVNT